MNTCIEIFIGLGSNLGGRLDRLSMARAALQSKVGRLLSQSAIVETTAEGMAAGTPAFLNQVVGVEVLRGADPQAVMAELLCIEQVLGRVRNERDHGGYASRTIDLDLLLWPELECSLRADGVAPELILPHPRLLERDFVLGGLAEIAGRVEIPGASMAVGEALEKLRQG
jgi:2-amino-4-hydroxy-6-hydroxymethyldihydropteridine diphosphokinase